MGGVDGGESTRVGEYIYLSYPLSQQMPVATRPGRCCHVFGWSVRVLSPFLLLSLRPSLSRFILPPLPPSFGFFLFGKRFSPFLPRDRTLTLRRRSRGVENTGSTTRRDETDVSRSFLSIARTVTFRLRDISFSPHSIESFPSAFLFLLFTKKILTIKSRSNAFYIFATNNRCIRERRPSFSSCSNERIVDDFDDRNA